MIIDIFLNSKQKDIKRKRDVLLITGDGKTLPADLQNFYNMDIAHDTMCMGRSLQLVPKRIEHYSDVDADNDKWVIENLEKNHPDKVTPETLKHTLGFVEWCDCDWDIKNCPWPMADVMFHGSTALFSVLIGLKMGYKRIYLAGCPIDSKGHWYFVDEEYGPRWSMETYQVWLEFSQTEDADKVRSLSGYTKTLLGNEF